MRGAGEGGGGGEEEEEEEGVGGIASLFLKIMRKVLRTTNSTNCFPRLRAVIYTGSFTMKAMIIGAVKCPYDRMIFMCDRT